jgi:superoxide dismutase, Cu-Zn family
MIAKMAAGVLAAVTAWGLLTSAGRAADDLTVTMNKVSPDGVGEAVGTISITQSPDGAQFKLALHGLPPGPHGFHVHQNGNCMPTLVNGVRIPGGAAGGHWDPGMTGKHAGPLGDGHKGDLLVLEVSNAGTADQTLGAPHIKNIEDLRGRSLMIHVGGDNYSDEPAALGGGGLRFACGVIPK